MIKEDKLTVLGFSSSPVIDGNVDRMVKTINKNNIALII
jgi:hypothetical protein